MKTAAVLAGLLLHAVLLGADKPVGEHEILPGVQQALRQAGVQRTGHKITPTVIAGVVPLIDIEPRDVHADQKITVSIEARLAADVLAAPTASRVQVLVENGLVTLEGNLSYAGQQQAVGEVARQVAGGRQVDNRITHGRASVFSGADPMEGDVDRLRANNKNCLPMLPS
jgi:osmotically-inducible protein OsmY